MLLRHQAKSVRQNQQQENCSSRRLIVDISRQRMVAKSFQLVQLLADAFQ